MTPSPFTFTACMVLTLTSTAGRARGESSPPLQYQAPAGCPSRADLAAAIAARGGALESPGAFNPATIRITIKPSDDGFDGALRVERADKTSTSRDVHAAQCAEIVDGLALVAALALREFAARAPEAEPRLQASGLRYERAVEVSAGTLRFDRVMSYTLEAGATTGLFPTVLPRYDLSISRANFVTPPSQPSYLVGPILRVHWSYFGPATHRFDDFTTNAWGFQGGLGSCLGITYDTRGWVLLGCGEFAVGLMHYDTKNGAGEVTQSKNGGFGTASVTLDAQYNFGSLLHASLKLGGQAQLGNLSAEAPNGNKLFEAPLFGGFLMGGLGLHFQ